MLTGLDALESHREQDAAARWEDDQWVSYCKNCDCYTLESDLNEDGVCDECQEEEE